MNDDDDDDIDDDDDDNGQHSMICINIKWCISKTQQNFIMFIILLGQHVSILIESSSGPPKKIDTYLEMLKCFYKNPKMLP